MSKLVRWIDAVILICLLVAALFFRTNDIEGKMTFEWDQARDMQAVQNMVTTRTPVLLGPIVRGEVGGFYLAPAYYYLLTPVYIVSGGNPLALAWVSIGADLLLIVFLYFFLRARTSRLTAFLMAAIWAGSPLIIRGAFTPWNVSFIPLWSLAFIAALLKLQARGRLRDKCWVIFLASLTTSIHFSLVPLSLIILVFNYRHFLRLPFRQYVWLAVSALIPVFTLVIYDLTHHFENTILFKRFIFGVSTKPVSLLGIIPVVLEKFGYTVGRLFTGEPMTVLGLSMMGALLIFAWFQSKQKKELVLSAAFILILLFTLIVYRDSDFAEYYFLPVFVPILIILGYMGEYVMAHLPSGTRYIIAGGILAIYVHLGNTVRISAPSPYSLSVKREVLLEIGRLDYPVEVRTSPLPRERNTGFDYLMHDIGLVSDPGAARKVYIYEAKNMEIIAPPEARSIIVEKNVKAFKYIVFSN